MPGCKFSHPSSELLTANTIPYAFVKTNSYYKSQDTSNATDIQGWSQQTCIQCDEGYERSEDKKSCIKINGGKTYQAKFPFKVKTCAENYRLDIRRSNNSSKSFWEAESWVTQDGENIDNMDQMQKEWEPRHCIWVSGCRSSNTDSTECEKCNNNYRKTVELLADTSEYPTNKKASPVKSDGTDDPAGKGYWYDKSDVKSSSVRVGCIEVDGCIRSSASYSQYDCQSCADGYNMYKYISNATLEEGDTPDKRNAKKWYDMSPLETGTTNNKLLSKNRTTNIEHNLIRYTCLPR